MFLNVTKRYLQKMSHFTQILSWYRQYLLTLTYNPQGHGVVWKVTMWVIRVHLEIMKISFAVHQIINFTSYSFFLFCVWLPWQQLFRHKATSANSPPKIFRKFRYWAFRKYMGEFAPQNGTDRPNLGVWLMDYKRKTCIRKPVR